MKTRKAPAPKNEVCGNCPKLDKGWCQILAKMVTRNNPKCAYGRKLEQ